MTMWTKRAAAAAMALTGLVSAAVLTTTAGAADDDWTGGPVDIRVELDLPTFSDGPLVQEVIGVTPGPGVELTRDHIVDNPDSFCGSTWVDIDPVSQTVTVATGQIREDPSAGDPISPIDGLQDGYEWNDCDFETATVTITGVNFATFTLVSDDLWEPEDQYNKMVIDGPTLSGDVAGVAWNSESLDPDSAAGSVDMGTPGSAVFAYTVEVVDDTTTTTVPDEETTTTTTVPDEETTTTTTVADDTTTTVVADHDTAATPATASNTVAPAATAVQASPTYTG